MLLSSWTPTNFILGLEYVLTSHLCSLRTVRFRVIRPYHFSRSCNPETTASGIVTTLAYLALYPEEQYKAWLEVSSVFPDGLTLVRASSGQYQKNMLTRVGFSRFKQVTISLMLLL